MAYADKVSNMRRVLVYYRESGHIYLSGLLTDSCVMVEHWDSDAPYYMQFNGTEDTPPMEKLYEYLSVRPEFKDLEFVVLDEETQRFDPRTGQYFNDTWLEYLPAYREVH
jgi:hypothetical protein